MYPHIPFINLNFKNKKEIFNYFIGSWKVKRILGKEGSVEGLATFTLKDTCIMRYREEVSIKLNNFKELQKAYKEYVYKYDEQTATISKNFIDYSVFYELNFINAQKAYGTHTCGNDTYKAIYNLFSKNYFTLEYQVIGLSKNFTIFTEFIKIQDDSS